MGTDILYGAPVDRIVDWVATCAQRLRPQVERLVIRQIQLQRAERIGMQISDENLNLALAGIAERNGVSLNDLPAMLAQEGIDYASYRAEMRDQLIVEQLRQRDVIGSTSSTGVL